MESSFLDTYSFGAAGLKVGQLYTVSDSGWMECPHFLEWFKKQFLPAVSIAS